MVVTFISCSLEVPYQYLQKCIFSIYLKQKENNFILKLIQLICRGLLLVRSQVPSFEVSVSKADLG